jgi:hypothetical protein
MLLSLLSAVFISRGAVPGVENTQKLGAPYFQLSDNVMFVQDCEYYIRFHSLGVTKARYNMQDLDVETPEEMYLATTEDQTKRIMWYCGGMIVILALLPALYICRDKKSRMPYMRAALAGAPVSEALAQILALYIVTALVSLLSQLCLVFFYVPYIVSELGASYFVRCLVQRVVTDLALISVPMLLAYLIDLTPICVITGAAYGVFSMVMNISAAGTSALARVPFPTGYLQGLRGYWSAGAAAGDLAFYFCSAAACILICAAASALIFRQKAKKYRAGIVNPKGFA